MDRARDPYRLVDTVATAEEAGWDLTKPNTLNRARALLERILRSDAPDLADIVYGEDV